MSRLINNNRICYIDALKGIGIVLVVIGHSFADLYSIPNRFILSFHMPLFFFASGLLLKEQCDNIKYFTIKKIKSLGKYIIILGIVRLSEIVLFDCMIKQTYVISEINILSQFKGWFLWSLLGALVLFEQKKRFKLPLYVILIIEIILFCIIYYSGFYTYFELVLQILVASIFIDIGCLSKHIIKKLSVSSKCWYDFVFVILVFFVGILSYLNEPIGMYMNQYGNPIMFLTTAILGVAMTCFVAVRTDEGFITWCGKNSIHIYILHVPILRVVKVIYNYMLPHQYHVHWLTSMVCAVISICIVAGFIYVSQQCNVYLKNIKQNSK